MSLPIISLTELSAAAYIDRECRVNISYHSIFFLIMESRPSGRRFKYIHRLKLILAEYFATSNSRRFVSWRSFLAPLRSKRRSYDLCCYALAVNPLEFPFVPRDLVDTRMVDIVRKKDTCYDFYRRVDDSLKTAEIAERCVPYYTVCRLVELTPVRLRTERWFERVCVDSKRMSSNDLRHLIASVPLGMRLNRETARRIIAIWTNYASSTPRDRSLFDRIRLFEYEMRWFEAGNN